MLIFSYKQSNLAHTADVIKTTYSGYCRLLSLSLSLSFEKSYWILMLFSFASRSGGKAADARVTKRANGRLQK